MKLAPGLIPPPIANGLIVAVSLFWGVDVVRYLIDPGHQLSGVIGTAFASVCAFVFATRRKPDENGDPKDGEGEGGDPEPAPTPTPDPPPSGGAESTSATPNALSVAELLRREGRDGTPSTRRRGEP